MNRTIKLIVVTALLLVGIFSSLSCMQKPVWGLSAHTLKTAQGTPHDVVWVVRDREVIYRCTAHQNRPYCVKASFR